MPRAVRVRKTLRRQFTQEQIAFCRGVFAAADVVEGGQDRVFVLCWAASGEDIAWRGDGEAFALSEA